ncbi:MAG TPA: magnesium transporter CorA family protein [Burkholderiales bacterium]|jgi:magnesium/cobalt transport protein CorA
MQLMLISQGRIEPCNNLEAIPEGAFAWLDSARSEPAEAWRSLAERLTGKAIHDSHVRDACNAQHPSSFDNTADYEVIIFRGLLPSTGTHENESSMGMGPDGNYNYGPENACPFVINTAPACFILFERMVVTVRSDEAPQTEQVRKRLLSNAAKPPTCPEDLVQRVLNAMVDRYLELRLPLSQRLARWQKDLLDPSKPFHDWRTMLDQRVELHKLQQLCEEQRDAVAEWLDNQHDALSDAMNVRINDLLNHIERVLNHTESLERTAESAVQLHFSATAHRTNEIMRTLTIINAVFLPLTFIAGVFGMNFRIMPLLNWRDGFWMTMLFMLLLAASLVIYFKAKRYFAAKGATATV